MQYPTFLTIFEAKEVLRIGRTSLYARINDGSLQTAKMGRGTRITFSSVIEYAMRCLREGNGPAEHPEVFSNVDEVQSWTMAEHLARRLCYIHCTPDEGSGEGRSTLNPEGAQALIHGSPQKNSGGES
jgi:excisionase family DNA binding protein